MIDFDREELTLEGCCAMPILFRKNSEVKFIKLKLINTIEMDKGTARTVTVTVETPQDVKNKLLIVRNSPEVLTKKRIMVTHGIGELDDNGTMNIILLNRTASKLKFFKNTTIANAEIVEDQIQNITQLN